MAKIVSALFCTFSTLFSPRTSLKIKAFFRENQKKKTKPFCTLVVARRSSSNVLPHLPDEIFRAMF